VLAQPQQPTISDLYAAVREENYDRLKAVAAVLGKRGNAADQQTALLLSGRALLGLGEVAEADRHLQHMAGMQFDDNGKLLLRVYGAWLASLKGDDRAAVKTLDEIMATQVPVEATAEAAEVLARLHVARGDTKAAQRAVGFGRQFLAYHKIESAYLEALFRRRLAKPATKSTKEPLDEAEVLFKQAESLRLKGKPASAIPLYHKLVKDHASGPWADPSGFRLGECLLLAGKGPQARQQWQDFVRAKPSGPWRGQASVALADIALEYDVDAKAALAIIGDASRIVSEEVEPPAKESWHAATFDIHFRHGAAAILSEKYDDAERAFRAAKGAVSTQVERTAGLEQLIAMATEERHPAPPETREGACGTLLGLARLSNLVGHFEKSAQICGRLIKGEVRNCSAAQRAYALYEQAYGLDHTKKSADALKNYLLSLQTFRRGTWHDATLYRSAMLTQEIARKLPDPPGRAVGEVKKLTGEAVTPSDRECRRQEKAIAEAARVQGKVKALPLWTQLLDGFPESPHREAALYFAGVLCFETDRPAEAQQHLVELVKKYPSGPYAGDAHVKLADVAIELLFDLAAAKSAVHDGLAWLRQQDRVAARLSDDGGVGDQARPRDGVEFDLRVRAGLVEYLDGRPADAIAHFESAKLFEPPRKLVVVSGHIPGAVERLVTAAKAGKPLVPQEVDVGHPNGALCLRVASLYYEAEQYEHGIRLCNKLLDSMPKATRDQRSWAYFLRGRCLHAQRLPLEAMDSFGQSVGETARASWKPTALFYMGNAIFNYAEDEDAAIALWNRAAREFPESEEAERGQYHVGFALMHSGRHQEARDAFDKFLKARPGSIYERAIRVHHLPRIDELEAEQKVSASAKGQQ
jgi:tetratricopeptide (TPR) repeat protein